MDNKNIFIILILICLLIMIFNNKNENFIINSNDDEENKNIFYKPLKNIFLSDSYDNYEKNEPTKDNKIIQPLNTILYDSFLYSKPTIKKIICSSHKNRADCWEDNVNNCQWIHKIDGKSFCNVAPNWIL